MSGRPWQGSPGLEAKGHIIENESSKNNNNIQMPHLVAPRPIYASSSPLTHYDSNRSGQSKDLDSPNRNDADNQQQPKRSSTSRPPSSMRALADPDAILPVQGDEGDVISALEKLDRMQKASQKKRHWIKRTGYEGLAMVATAGGKNAVKKEKKQIKKEIKDDESAHFEPRFGEVKLGISSLPGYTVFAAQKAKFQLGRSNTELDLVSDKNEQRRSSVDHGVDGRGSILNRMSLRRNSHQQARRGSAALSITEEQKTPERTVNSQNNVEPHTPDTTTRIRPAAPSLDLTSVKEEGRLDDLVKKPKRTPLSLTTQDIGTSKSAFLQKPLLMVQSPSEGGLETQPIKEAPLAEELGSPFTSRPSSINSSHSDVDGNGDAEAEAIADACRQDVSRISFQSPGDETMRTYLTSSSSASSDDEGSASDSEGSDIPVTQQEEYFLSLEHGEELTKKQKKKLLHRMRHGKTGAISAEERLGGGGGGAGAGGTAQGGKRQHKRTGSLSNKVQLGLHYASSQSRNRRAMERYSPHPSRPNSTLPQTSMSSMYPGGKTDSSTNLTDLLVSARAGMPGTSATPSLMGLADISRSSTPGLGLAQPTGSRRSSMSEKDRVFSNGMENGEADFCISPVAESTMDREDRWADLSKYLPKRQGTASSITSSLTGNPSFRKKYLSLRRKKQNTSDVVEESDSDHNVPKEEDPEQELDKVLGNLIAQQAPEELQETYEYDVLYENQRGLMVFGIPKFSAKTLFQWDPNPWTNAHNGNSAYNIVNAQLPNPSWEWVHPEWLIDMSGDVDESGWQYSFNFGRFSLPLFTRPSQSMPRANSKSNELMNERMAKKLEKQQNRENNREDDGFEALKRTARSRSAKWTGIPNQDTYVRRRRWIRLRQRKAVYHQALSASNTPGIGTPLGLGKASGDWAQLVEEEKLEKERRRERVDAGVRSSSSSSSNDGSLSGLESDETDSCASDDAGSSAFLPRQIPGHLRNGVDPTKVKAGKEQRRQKRHAREFTGTIRDLKNLLPAILDRRNLHRPSTRQKLEKELWMTDIDARNPFISWNVVKKRLDDDDLAFASASLRARERRYAQKLYETNQRAERKRNSPALDSEIKRIDTYSQRDQSYELTKDALVEINYRRIMRIMRACKVDRQKLLLWKIWLGVEPITSITEVAREEDLASTGLGINATATSESVLREKRDRGGQAKSRIRKVLSSPDTMDVWDLLERRLDRVLLTFEYQGSRASLIRLLLTIHATSHSNHRFKQSHWSIEADNNQNVEPNAPSSLSPQFGSKEALNRGVAPAGDEWRAVNLPRLEFWSDLEKCARGLLDGSAADGKLTSSPSNMDASPLLHGGDINTMPLLNSLNRGSPAPSLIRSGTPTMTTGSLANGPTARRYSHSVLGSSAPINHSSSIIRNGHSPSRREATSPPPHTGPDDRDRNFLADLLHLPLQSQRDLLVKTAAGKGSEVEREPTPTSSNLIRRLTMAAEEEDGDF